MEHRTRAAVAALGIAGIFLLVQLGALALVEPFQEAGLQATENPQNTTNSVVYIVALLVMTGFMLLAFKYDLDAVIRGVIILTGGYIGFIVLSTIIPASMLPVAGTSALAWAAAGAIVLGLVVHPEWYVIDAAGIVMGAGAAGLFGISFGVLPALILLAALAVYDAISVYGTEHMLTLAESVMDLRIPVVLVVPLTLSYSFLDDGTPASVDDDADGENESGDAPELTESNADSKTDSAEQVAEDAEEMAAGNEEIDEDGEQVGEDGEPIGEDGEPIGEDGKQMEEDDEESDEDADPLDREALFIGLGDAVIPTVLIASAAFFAPDSVPAFDIPGIAMPLTALTAMVGTFLGLAILIRMVLKGRAHAGLPLLNGGAIGGYLVGALASGLSIAQALGLSAV